MAARLTPQKLKTLANTSARKAVASFRGKFRRGRLRSARKLFKSLNVRTIGSLGKEIKFHDAGLDDFTITADILTGMLNPREIKSPGPPVTYTNHESLVFIPQGTKVTERIGKKISVMSIDIQGAVQLTPAETHNTGCIVTLWLVLDRQTNGTEMKSDDLLLNKATGAHGLPHSKINPFQTARFRVLAKVQLDMRPSGASLDPVTTATGDEKHYTYGEFQTFRMRKDFPKGLTIHYSDASASVGSIPSNSLHLVGLSNVGGGCAQITYNARVRFKG